MGPGKVRKEVSSQRRRLLMCTRKAVVAFAAACRDPRYLVKGVTKKVAVQLPRSPWRNCQLLGDKMTERIEM